MNNMKGAETKRSDCMWLKLNCYQLRRVITTRCFMKPNGNYKENTTEDTLKKK